MGKKIKRVLCIEVGLTKTKLCETNYLKKHTKLYHCAILDTPENTIEDAYVRDRKLFAEFLSDEIQKAGIKTKHVVFTLVSNKIISREVFIPLVKEKLIPEVIEAEKYDYFPMDITDHTLAYTVLERLPQEKQLRLMVYAIPATLILNYENLARDLKLTPVAYDYVGNSVYQWLRLHKGKTQQAIPDVVLQINEQVSMLTIFQNGLLSLQRTINYGINTFAEAILDSRAYGELRLSEAQALLFEKRLLKETYEGALPMETEAVETEEDTLARLSASEAVMDVSRSFLANVLRILEYHTDTKKTPHITEIAITGMGARILGLRELFENEMNLTVCHIKTLEGLHYGKNLKDSVDSDRLLSCVGAVCEPVQYLSVKFDIGDGRSPIRFYVFMLCLSFLAGVTMIFSAKLSYDDAYNQNIRLQQEEARRLYINDIYQNYLDAMAASAAVVGMDASLFDINARLTALFAELEDKLPSHTVVHSFQSANHVFSMNLTVDTKADAQKLLLQLQSIPYVAQVQISGITEQAMDEGITTVSFSVSFLLVDAPEEAVDVEAAETEGTTE